MASLSSRKRISLPCCPHMGLLYSQLSEVGARTGRKKVDAGAWLIQEAAQREPCLSMYQAGFSGAPAAPDRTEG